MRCVNCQSRGFPGLAAWALRKAYEADEAAGDRVAALRQEFTVELAGMRNAMHVAVSGLHLEVTREFVSVEHLREVEERLIAAINRINEKLDQLMLDRPRRAAE